MTLAVQETGQRDYLEEWYGYSCVDAGHLPGAAGADIATHVATVLGHSDLWPLATPLVDLLWLTLQGAAHYLGLSHGKVRRLVAEGDLSGEGWPLRIRKSELDRYINRSRIRPGQLGHLNDYANSK